MRYPDITKKKKKNQRIGVRVEIIEERDCVPKSGMKREIRLGGGLYGRNCNRETYEEKKKNGRGGVQKRVQEIVKYERWKKPYAQTQKKIF